MNPEHPSLSSSCALTFDICAFFFFFFCPGPAPEGDQHADSTLRLPQQPVGRQRQQQQPHLSHPRVVWLRAECKQVHKPKQTRSKICSRRSASVMVDVDPNISKGMCSGIQQMSSSFSSQFGLFK